jgi:hypothetical protein
MKERMISFVNDLGWLLFIIVGLILLPFCVILGLIFSIKEHRFMEWIGA